MTSIAYRGYRIFENDFRAHPNWRSVRWLFHPEDADPPVCGFASSIEEAKHEIDMQIAELEEA